MYIISQLKKRHYEIIKKYTNSAYNKHFSLQIFLNETFVEEEK